MIKVDCLFLPGRVPIESGQLNRFCMVERHHCKHLFGQCHHCKQAVGAQIPGRAGLMSPLQASRPVNVTIVSSLLPNGSGQTSPFQAQPL